MRNSIFSWTVLLVQSASSLALAGVIWFVQVVHYPLYTRVPAQGFASYEEEHQRRTGWVVGPLMALETLGALLLVRWRPEGISLTPVISGLFLLAIIWLSTFFLQMPTHKALGKGFDWPAHRLLVRGSWIHTAAWTARAGIALAMLASARH